MPGQYPSALLAQFRQMNEYQQRAVLAGPGLFLLAGCPGCLDGETTQIAYRRCKRSGSRAISLRDLYRKFNGLPARSGPWRDYSQPTFTHSLGLDGIARYNQILAVVYSGLKPCIKITAEDGSFLICTLEHPFLTVDFEYIQASMLRSSGQPGVEVLMLGSMLPEGTGGKRPTTAHRFEVFTKFHPHGRPKTIRAEKRMVVPKDYRYLRVRRSKAVIEAAMNGVPYELFIHTLKTDANASSCFQYLDPRLEIHHIDENPRNDSLGNLRVMTKEAHSRLHGKTENFHTEYFKKVRIVDVEWAGLRDTYDIKMGGPDYNFSANGFFVHNSGKTTTIIARLARLVADGVRPENILAMTFTNAGVESMKTKLLQLGIHPDSMEICTIHSLCHQILGKETHVLAGLSLDGNRLAWERKKALLAMRKSKGYSATGGGVDDVGRYIADVKARGPVYIEGNPFGLNSLGSEFAREMAEIWAPRLKVSTRHAHNVYMGMEEHRAVLGVYDYDDMLNWAWLVLLADADVRQRWRMRYSLVIVDEMQDNCPVQWDLAYLLSGLSSSIPITKHLAPEPDGLPTGYNLMAGGDILQCLDIDTPIETKAGGVVELSTISIGDEIAVLTREGKRYREVTKVWDVTRQERCEVKLVDGTKLGGHPFHLVFAALQPRQDHYQVYLMYRSDLGYRLGVTRGPATKGESLIVRTSQEGASRLWFVRSESTAAEASYWEQALSLKYQIPTYPFRLTGRNLRLDEDGLARLFKNYGWNGEQLLDDYALSFDRPLYSPKATHSNRLVINIVLSSAKGKAELSIESRHLGSIKDLIESTRDSLHVTLSGSKGEVDCWRVRTHALDGAGAELLGLELLTRIREARPDLDIVIRTSLFSVKTGEHTAFRATTLSALRPGVSVLTERGPVGVASCSMAEGSYTFRDIAVADVASYLANGIAVHNSIYGFRSAEPTMLLEFAKREDVTILELPINYRSVPQICRCANRIVEGEPWHISGEMVSSRGDAQSPSVRICEFDSKEEEISWILDQAVELGPHSCAVLARMNSTLDLVEVECVKRRVKYFKRNKGSFFTSKIVQDLLAYLRVACWCDDTGRWAKHVINKPFRFFSAKDLRDAETEGLRQGTNALYGLKQNMREMSFQKRQRVRELLGLMTELNRMAIAAEETAGKEAYEPENGPYAMLRLVLERTKYIEEVRQQEGLMALDESKAGLARELQRMATAFQSPRSLLAYIDHMAIAVKRAKDIGIRVDNEESGALVLSTIHSAKGLQWPNVIIASVDQGTFPCEWSESYEEEVRLFYVAITRAADRCYATLTKPLSGADGKPVYSSLITKLKEALALEDGNAHGNEGSKRDEQAGDAHTIRADGGHAGREPHQADAAQSKGGDVRAGATGWPAPARP